MAEIAKLLARLQQLGATEQECAEALWLATHITASGSMPVGLAATAAIPGDRAQERSSGGRKHAATESSEEPKSPKEPKPWPPVPVGLPVPAGQARPEIGEHALPLRLPEVTEIPEPLELQRALRPLKRTVKGKAAQVLDEEATVTASADADTIIPVLAPSAERWLSLTLVLDTSPSMILWDKLIAELQVLLAQIGAFRVIRTWNLRLENGRAAISSPGSAGVSRDPLELIDPTGRQAILVVSDCVAEAWKADGIAMKTIATWAGNGPVAIIQPLVKRLWARSAAPCYDVRLKSPDAGVPNTRLELRRHSVDRADRPQADKPQAKIPVPVLEISPDWFASWARLVAGPSEVEATVTLAGVASAAEPPASRTVDDVTEPRRIVEEFKTGASPEAFRLAGLLAGREALTLPVMRHIQRKMIPDYRPNQLAEVFLGGLLQAVAPPLPADLAAPEKTSFEFPPPVRAVLRSTVRRSEAELVSDLFAFDESPDRQQGFAATIRASGRTGMPYSGYDQGTVDGDIVARRQGPYLDAVALSTRRRRYSIMLAGAPGTGQTTFLAALYIALSQPASASPLPVSKELQAALGGQSSTPWRVIGNDPAASDLLSRITAELADHGFPQAPHDGENLNVRVTGQIPVPEQRRYPIRRNPQKLDVRLDLIDSPGERADGQGVIFFYDPTREYERNDFFERAEVTVDSLRRRTKPTIGSDDGPLPHHAAVCVTKFDDFKVFRRAERLNLVTFDPTDPYGFPRVRDDDAKEFFAEISKPDQNVIERSFRPDRIKYFVASSVGFYLAPGSDYFDDDDTQNVVQDPEGRPWIRSRVHPINVVDPVLWLARQLVSTSR